MLQIGWTNDRLADTLLCAAFYSVTDWCLYTMPVKRRSMFVTRHLMQAQEGNQPATWEATYAALSLPLDSPFGKELHSRCCTAAYGTSASS